MENNKYKIKEPIITADFYYDLTWGGYIKPSEVLTDQVKAKTIEDAIKVLEDWADELNEDNMIEYL